jgi:hypothetical protein
MAFSWTTNSCVGRHIIWEYPTQRFERLENRVDAHPKRTAIAVHYNPTNERTVVLVAMHHGDLCRNGKNPTTRSQQTSVPSSDHRDSKSQQASRFQLAPTGQITFPDLQSVETRLGDYM